MKALIILFLSLGIPAFVALFAPAGAQGAAQLTVTNCSNETELRNKIVMLQEAQGGTLNFNCGTTTIALSSQLPLIEYDTTIDGGNKITLNGQDNVRVFQVSADGTLRLKNIVLDKGHANGNAGGAIYNLGNLTLNHVTIQNSYGPLGGGAIYTNGKLDMTDSVLAHNRASRGGAIFADEISRRTEIAGSKFDDNIAESTGAGGALYSSGSFSISTSEFTRNKAGNGGAIYARRAFLNTDGTISGAKFEGNEANGDDPNANGGALYIENLNVQLAQSRMQKNFAREGGAIHVAVNGRVEIADSTFADNQAFVGGALVNYGQGDVNASTLLGNLALGGGGLYNGGLLSVRNATFAGNGSVLGAALYQDTGSAILTNVTMVSNTTDNLNGSTIANRQDHQPYLALTNVLIDNPEGTINCDFETAPALSMNNLSSDNTCGFGTGRDSVKFKLGPLTNNGGYTQTFLPQAGSPAIDSGTSINAPTTDQRGIARPKGAGFDVGAVEVDPAAPTATRTRTPTVQHPPSATPTATHTSTKTPTTPGCTGKPSKPTLQKPKNGKVIKGSVAKLDWDNTQCAQKFKVVIKNGSPNGTRFQKKGGLLVSEFKTGPLVSGQSYVWRVIAINDSGKTKSEWWTLTAN